MTEATRNLRVLLVAPQPFYRERGTPIAVRLLATTLAELGHEVDLLVYHDGDDIRIPGVRIFRAARPPGVGKVPIGISVQKLLCDLTLCASMVKLLVRTRYDIVHALEEAIFPALVFNLFSRRRTAYDMDSALSDQLIDKWPAMRPLSLLLRSLERWAARRSDVIFVVCEDLGATARECQRAEAVVVLPDIPIAGNSAALAGEDLRVRADGRCLALYVGNLERYQGVELMVEAMALLPAGVHVKMLVVGGEDAHIGKLQQMILAQGLESRIELLGRRQVAALEGLLSQADVLLSPRILGNNTPMKIYSYMQSGVPTLATRIRSHTQVLDDGCALLCEPTAAALARGLQMLVEDPALRDRLGTAARQKVEREFSLTVFRSRLKGAYDRIAAGVTR